MKEISKETINKISQTKLEDGRKRILEGFIKNDIPEQSNNNLAIPSHRTREWISFDQFKDLIGQGKPLQELCKLYSKHLMAFYSYLSKGKISLTKEQFEEQYNQGIPLDEIGRANNIPREHITYLREYYGIKRKGATYQKRLQNEVPLSQDAKDIIIGSLLGDGYIDPDGYFTEKHSQKQLEYLQWKASYLKPVSNGKSWYYYESIDERSGTLIKSHQFRTTVHSFFHEMRNKFYVTINGKNKKIIPHDIYELLNEKVLAILFMDDGVTDWKYRNGYKMTYGSLPSCKICSESFTEDDNIKLSNAINKKFQIESYVKNKEEDLKPQLKFSTENSQKLLNLIKKYTHNSLLYKITEDVYSLNLSIEEIRK